jgi:hypothetical protein
VLTLLFTQTRFINFFQSGFYLDYFIKKLVETLSRSLLVWAATFFGEKFFVEYLTKKSMDSMVSWANLFTFNRENYSSLFFLQVTTFSFYVFLIVEILYLFY